MLRSLLALFVIAVFAVYAVKSAYAAMLMYWWFGIFRPQEWMWWDVSSLRLPLLAAALFIVSALARGYYPRSTHPLWLLVLAFYAAALLATVNACSSYEPVTIVYISILVLVTLVTERTLETPKQVWGLVFVASLSLGYYNADLGFHSLLNSYSLYDRPIARGSFSDSNSSALGAAMGVFLQLFVIGAIGSGNKPTVPAVLMRRTVRILFKTLLYGILVGSIIFVIKTESRGSAISMLTGFVVWTLLHPRKTRILSFWGLAIVAVLIVGISDSYRERLGSAFVESHELDHSAASRPHYWDTAERMAQDNVFGVGIGCYKQLYNEYDNSDGLYGYDRSVHSSHYSVLAETGYPGFAVWVALLLGSYATLFRMRSRTKRTRLLDPTQDLFFTLSNALIVAFTVFVVGGSFYELAYNDYTWLMFAITIAASRLQRRILADQVAPANGARQDDRTAATRVA